MVVHRLSSMNFIREEGRVPQVRGFFMLQAYRLVAEIISTTRVANAIISDNDSYTLMLITPLSRGKPNTSDYPIGVSISNLLQKKKGPPHDSINHHAAAPTYHISRTWHCTKFPHIRKRAPYVGAPTNY